MDEGRRTKVLFFVWGDSIHARRRIKIFTDDPSFEVGVVSTYAYDFENARNYYLADARLNVGRRPWIQRVLRALLDPILVKKYAYQFRPDVIFLQTLLYPAYLSYFLPSKLPMMITFWNGDVTWWAESTGIKRVFKKQIVLYGVRRAAAITVNSKVAQEACFGYGASEDKVKLIRYPGANLEKFIPVRDKRSARERLGLRHGKVVLCPRGLGGYLNSDVIIEAAAEVIRLSPDTLFLFISGVGSEEIKQEHLRRAAELGISANIRMDGKISWELMPVYYQSADVMVSISSNDSLPNCMLEAMACGIPVVMGDIPQIREWVKDGDNGYLVPPRDPIALTESIKNILTKDDEMINRFIKTNIEMVKREADSQVMRIKVTSLVHQVASKTTH